MYRIRVDLRYKILDEERCSRREIVNRADQGVGFDW